MEREAETRQGPENKESLTKRIIELVKCSYESRYLNLEYPENPPPIPRSVHLLLHAISEHRIILDQATGGLIPIEELEARIEPKRLEIARALGGVLSADKSEVATIDVDRFLVQDLAKTLAPWGIYVSSEVTYRIPGGQHQSTDAFGVRVNLGMTSNLKLEKVNRWDLRFSRQTGIIKPLDIEGASNSMYPNLPTAETSSGIAVTKPAALEKAARLLESNVAEIQSLFGDGDIHTAYRYYKENKASAPAARACVVEVTRRRSTKEPELSKDLQSSITEHETGHLYNSSLPDRKIWELIDRLKESKDIVELANLSATIKAREEIGGNLCQLRYAADKTFGLREVLSGVARGDGEDPHHTSAERWIVDKIVEHILADKTHFGFAFDNDKYSPWETAVMAIPDLAENKAVFEAMIDKINVEFRTTDIQLETEYRSKTDSSYPAFAVITPREVGVLGGLLAVGGLAIGVSRVISRRNEVAKTENLIDSLFAPTRQGRKQAKDLARRLQLGLQNGINTTKRKAAVEELLDLTKDKSPETRKLTLELVERLRGK